MMIMLTKIGLDGGGAFFKVALSLINQDDEELRRSTEKYKDTSVLKLLILGLVPKMQEKYSNVSHLWSKYTFTEMESVIAGDLKILLMHCRLSMIETQFFKFF